MREGTSCMDKIEEEIVQVTGSELYIMGGGEIQVGELKMTPKFDFSH